MENELSRYHRQMLLPWIGVDGQRRLRDSHALVIGCGALGAVICEYLVRAGVGRLTIIDRDVVALTDLQRQALYDESDVEAAMPKAEAAKARLKRINHGVMVEAVVDDFSHANASSFVSDVDLILDGLDNFETRYLLNDLAVKHGLPWIHGGAMAAAGTSMTILPHPAQRCAESRSSVRWSAEQSTPCLRCVFPEPPAPGTTATCDTAGVLGPLAVTVAARQTTEAIKLLSGRPDAVDRSLWSIDVLANTTRRIDISAARRERGNGRCRCCVDGIFEYLDGSRAGSTIALCGRDAVQVTPARSSTGGAGPLDLTAIAERLRSHGSFTRNRFLLRGRFDAERGDDGERIELTLFPNGRAIVKGTKEVDVARTIYAKYIGT